MDNIVTDQQRMEAWLAARRQHITSTDLASVMALPDAYGTPIDVWLSKTGRAERGEVPEFMQWGTRLQRPILEGYAERVGVALEEADPYQLHEDPACPRLGASLDARWAAGDRRPVDAKLVGYAKPTQWGEQLTDQMPTRFLCQLQCQMGVTQTEIADLAVLVGGQKLVIYRARLDPQLLSLMREMAEEFWARYVATDTPPPVDGGGGWARFLATRAQRSEEIIVRADLDRWARGLRLIEQQEQRLKELGDLARNVLKAGIADAAGLQGDWGRISYCQGKPRTVVDWESLALGLEQLLQTPKLTAKKRAEKAAQLRAAFTEARPGSRAFRPSWSDEPDTEAIDVNALPTWERPALLPVE